LSVVVTPVETTGQQGHHFSPVAHYPNISLSKYWRLGVNIYGQNSLRLAHTNHMVKLSAGSNRHK
jgi:hypothetical protein